MIWTVLPTACCWVVGDSLISAPGFGIGLKGHCRVGGTYDSKVLDGCPPRKSSSAEWTAANRRLSEHLQHLSCWQLNRALYTLAYLHVTCYSGICLAL